MSDELSFNQMGEFSPLSTVELTTNWYQLLKGDYKRMLEHSFGKQLPTNFQQSLLDIYKAGFLFCLYMIAC